MPGKFSTDIGNNFAGTLMGVINAVGNTMGFIAPLVTGLITNHHNDVRHWQVEKSPSSQT